MEKISKYLSEMDNDFINDDYLKSKGISSMSLIHEKSFDPILTIIYENKSETVIRKEEKIINFFDTLK